LVLKLDVYGQIITTDSLSTLQLHSAFNGETSNDDSVSFLGSIFSAFNRGRATFTIGVKPSFASAQLQLGVATLQRQLFLYVAGTDMTTRLPMQSNVSQVHLANQNQSVCTAGSVLTLAAENAAGRPGACTVCQPGSYSLDPLMAPPGSTGPGCLPCPAGGVPHLDRSVNKCVERNYVY
jgi:hypothetical protein